MSSRLRAIAQDTVATVERGHYRLAHGEVSLAGSVADAVAGTRLYLPDEPVGIEANAGQARGGVPAGAVTNESSLAATRRLGGDVACLVFASARNPGGGFLNGAQAQEESLARGSALYACLRAAGDFYAYHRAHRDLTYSDRVIYSPRVPVFRDDRGEFLPEPYPVSFLTAAAPNRSAMSTDQRELADIPGVLRRRATRVLRIAAANGHRRLVLGAWGCGVFGNEPAVVADAFADALRACPWFDEITFAVLDRGSGTPTYTAFAEVLSARP
jgi:uncharacterized protein (TIGR02452 family)